MSTSAVRRKIKSSRFRCEHRPFGWSASHFSMKVFKKLKRDVDAGCIPKSALEVRIIKPEKSKISGKLKTIRG